MLNRNIYNNNSSIIQTRTNLVTSSNSQLSGMNRSKINANISKNNILSLMSKNNSIKSGGLIQRSAVNSMSLQSKSIQHQIIKKKEQPNIISETEIYTINDVLNINLFENKSIMIYSHYSKNCIVDTYNYYIINLFSTLVDTVFVLSNVSKDKWNVVEDNNLHILNYDFKNDFSNLYVFLMCYSTLLEKINRLFFVNDSFLVVDKNVFENKVKEDFFSHKYVEDYQGLILSSSHNIHYQSYFISIKNTIINKFIEYFKQNGYPKTHEESIHKYELELSRNFLNKNIKYFCYNKNPTAYYPYEIIKTYGIIKRQQLLSTYNIKEQLTYNQIQQLKLKYRDNIELVEYINDYSHK